MPIVAVCGINILTRNSEGDRTSVYSTTKGLVFNPPLDGINVTKVLLPNTKLVFVPVNTTSKEVFDSALEGLIECNTAGGATTLNLSFKCKSEDPPCINTSYFPIVAVAGIANFTFNCEGDKTSVC